MECPMCAQVQEPGPTCVNAACAAPLPRRVDARTERKRKIRQRRRQAGVQSVAPESSLGMGDDFWVGWISAHDDLTVRDARHEVFSAVEDGTSCPLCLQDVKLHPRPITAWWCAWLSCLYRVAHMHGDLDGFYHVDDVAKVMGPWRNAKHGGDYAKLRFFGLIEAHPSEQEESEDHPTRRRVGTAGRWRITPTGRAFCAGGAAAPKRVWAYNNVVRRVDSEYVTFREVLAKHNRRSKPGGFKHHYDELMGWLSTIS